MLTPASATTPAPTPTPTPLFYRTSPNRYLYPSTAYALPTPHARVSILVCAVVWVDNDQNTIDWKAYIGIDPTGSTSRAACEQLESHGAHLPQDDAVYYFPQLEPELYK